jgi:outer membrane receptor protein involved in Fe transport
MGRDVLLVGARAALRLREVELSLDVENLLDARWFDGEFVYASRFSSGAAELVPAPHVSVGPPRTLLLSLSLFL